MTLAIHPGDCYLINFPSNPTRHLQVVITSVEENTGNFVMVGIESVHKRSDRTKILHPNEHPFIIRDSAVTYRLADVYSLKWLKEKIDSGNADKKESMPHGVLKRICDGLLSSDQTRQRVREFFINATWKLESQG